MAVVVRCSCVQTRLNSGNTLKRSRPSDQSPVKDQFPVKSYLPGRLTCLPLQVEKFVLPIGNAFNGPFEICQKFSGGPSMPFMFEKFHFLNSRGSCDFNQVGHDYEDIVKQLSAQQVRRLPAMALLVTNALMLTAPLEALAETCEADRSIFNMPLLLFVALIGATVGGLLARQRRGELQRVNEQLRQINAALRRQAKIESYAPNLSYAPVGGSGRIPENEVIVDPRKQELISRLRAGKNYLRNQEPDRALSEFKTALELAQNLKDPIEEKKAARGVGASLQRQGKYREAIRYHSLVLEISAREGEDSGNTEAYGAIADCYTELGDLEQAGKFYDHYIARLETD